MSVKGLIFCCFFVSVISSCSIVKKVFKDATTAKSPAKPTPKPTTGTKPSSSTGNTPAPAASKGKVFTKLLNIDRSEFVSFAKTLLGTPYKYGSSNPKNGFDCSGFITYVFNHFNVKPPRSSVDFTNEGTNIDIRNAKPGEIILFTGSDNSIGRVGHMGIITKGGSSPQFIHSASGRSIGVIIDNVTGYYKAHFVKVIRLLE